MGGMRFGRCSIILGVFLGTDILYLFVELNNHLHLVTNSLTKFLSSFNVPMYHFKKSEPYEENDFMYELLNKV